MSKLTSKYMHPLYSITKKCRHCDRVGYFEEDEEGELILNEEGKLIQQDELKVCPQCKSVHYCCQKHLKLDWPKHKSFCKRFKNSLTSTKSLGITVLQEPPGHRSLPCTVFMIL
mmetsp:Transcript_50156/g.121532  ORF Transcript_50156/g.121532 Transcript_50156/m.121532 type:complete len:114 (+) Transcript_50156:231-572(+)